VAYFAPSLEPDPVSLNIDGLEDIFVQGINTCTNVPSDISISFSTWGFNPAIAQVTTGQVQAVAPGSTTGDAIGLILEGSGSNCVEVRVEPTVPIYVPVFSCSTSVTRGGTAQCQITCGGGACSSAITASGWKFKDGGGNTVKRTTNTTSLSWSGVMVESGTVSVTVGGEAAPRTASITVNPRSGFTFNAVSPTQTAGNSITCYNGDNTTLASPPNSTSFNGASCADLAFSFDDSVISDNGPNNGYRYVASVSSTSGSQQTQFPFIIVTDLLSATTFYNAQCGTYSSSDSSGFIAGSRLKQNVFDHEQGSVLSHWTEYRDAQNNSSNNVGTVLEAMTGPPGTAQTTYQDNLKTAGQNAQNRIVAAAGNELCNADPTQDTSQSCAKCGSINYSPYQQCSGQPVPYCH
jgi:hypothetical protein